MMKWILVLLCAVCFSSTALCQEFKWVQKGGGNGADYGRSLAIDNSGNTYVSGSYAYVNNSGTYTATFNTVSINNTSDGPNGYVAKFDTSGVTQWVKNITGPDWEYAYHVATDANGNVFVTGEFETSVTIDGTTVTTNSTSDDGVYLAKLSSTGTLAWLVSLESDTSLSVNDLVIDNNGDAWVTGDFDVWNFYLRKYSSSAGALLAECVSTRQPGSNSNGFLLGVDNANNIIAVGNYEDSVRIGNFGLPHHTFFVDYDIFVAKFNNTNAVPIWVQHGGGDPNVSNDGDNDQPGGISIDANNNIYISSSAPDTLKWGNVTKIVNLAGAFREKYFVKISPNGSVDWIKPVGVISSTGGSKHYPIRGNKIYFDLLPVDTLTIGSIRFNTSGNDMLLVVADTLMNLLGAYQISSNTSHSADIDGIALSQNADIYIAGSFRDTMTFGDLPFTTTTGGDKADMYIARILPCVIPAISIHPSGNMHLCYGHTIDATSDTILNGRYQWYLNDTAIFRADDPDYRVFAAGTYTVVVGKNGGCQSRSDALTVTSSPKAQLQVQPNVAGICPGDSVQLSIDNSYTSYIWSTGQTGVSTVRVAAGDHFVAVVDNHSCADTAFANVNQYAAPSQPQILKTACVLTSSVIASGLTYTWMQDAGSGYVQVGTDSSSHNAMETGPGTYQLEIENQNGCTNTSAALVVTGCTIGIAEVGPGFDFDLYLNPNTGRFMIAFHANASREFKISCLNILGEVVYSRELELPGSEEYIRTEVDLSLLAKGAYLVQLSGNGKSVYRNVIIAD